MNVRSDKAMYHGFVHDPVANGHFSEQLPNKCWSTTGASIDVEDLAMFFGENRDTRSPQRSNNTSVNHRVYRNRNVSSSVARNSSKPYKYPNSIDASSHGNLNNDHGCKYNGQCYQECDQNNFNISINRQVENSTWGNNGSNVEIGPKRYETRTKDYENSLPLGLGLPCTEQQWLACPATNCPIYDCVGNPSIDTNTSSIMLNQNGWNNHHNVTYFGPVRPPCMINVNPDTNFHIDSLYPSYYSQSHEEQQYFEDYLSNEKRKEKSRDAARSRRSRETDIFTELARVLPIPPEQPAHLDKATVMRLAIAYLKVRSVIDALEEPVFKGPSLAEMDSDFPKALDGFMLILSSNGDMVYLSDNVSDYLGITQMEMMGQSVYEYSHPCDHEELRECLSMKPSDVKEKRPCNFFLRLKCTLTSKGRKVNLKSASYKVIHCTGRAIGMCEPNIVKTDTGCPTSQDDDSSEYSSKEDDDLDTVASNSSGCFGASLVIVGSPIPHPSNIEIPLGRQTFLSKHSLSMKFTYADERLAEYLGWASNELLGKSVFEFHHALDNSALDKSFKSLFSKGQCETMAYRFLSKNGGYAWVVTQATLIHCSKQQKPISIVCVNHILSGVECEDEVYSERQLEARNAGVTVNSPTATTIDEIEIDDKFNLQSLPPLTLDTPSATDDSYDATDDFVNVNDRDEKNETNITTVQNFENQILIKDTKCGTTKNSRPLTVTESIFRSQADLACQDSRKEISNPISTKLVKNTDIRRERANWTFQDKPILQYEPTRNNRPQAVTKNVFVPVGLIQDQEFSQQHEQIPAVRPQTTTASIFAPRTEDMSKGFLTFSEDQPGLTMLKDEPEDLTHLAPTPGDVCVPLEDTPFLSDMLDEFILGTENYCPLLNTEDLPTELPNSDLSDSLTKDSNEMCGSLGSSLADSDPFIYRDMPSPCSLSPDLLSPSGIGKSPDQSSLGSFQSPKHNDFVDDMMTIRSGTSSANPITEDEMLMLSINDVIGDEELALRAPYIPMSDQDEALQLLISDDTVMWGPSQPPDKKTKWGQEETRQTSQRYEDSNLARLLKNDTAVNKYSHHDGGLVNPTQIFDQINEKGNNVSRLERPSKRVHAPISQGPTGETKRSRFNDSRLPIDQSLSCDVTSILENSMKTGNGLNYDEQSIDLCGIIDTSEKNNGTSYQEQQHAGSRLLLQQLMGRDEVDSTIMTKARDTTKSQVANLLKIVTKDGATVAAPRTENKEKIGFAGDGGGIAMTAALSGKQQQTNSVLMNLLVSGCDNSPSLDSTLQEANKWSPLIIDQPTHDLVTRNNDMTDMDLFAEYSITSDSQSSPFGNYLNGGTMDSLPRRCRYILDS